MQHCCDGGYALGYFESWNLESLQGTLDAAEQTRSPIIVGFNGDFLSRDGRRCRERLPLYGGLAKAAAQSANVPCGLIFNECPNDEWNLQAIDAGFNLIVPVEPTAPYDDYVRRLRRIVPLAHARHAAVEAELGELPCGASGLSSGHASLTDPAVAGEFVKATDVDLLAVSIGNVHIQLRGEQDLDLDRLEQIHKRVAVPLVLHGGTGISAGSLKAAIGLGVAKVNYGTYLKQRYLGAMQVALARCPDNPHEALGMGGEADIMVAGREAVRDAVLERISLLGCCGKA